MDLQAIVAQAQRVITSTIDEANAALNRQEPKEAKRLLTSGQRVLRDLKREVANAERDMRAEFQAARLQIDRSGQVIGAFGGSKVRGVMARGRAMEKRSLAAKKASAADGYRRVKSTIDDFIAQLDGAKFKVDSAIAQDRGQEAGKRPSPSPPPPPPPTSAVWAADPFGRHELRYWNGTAWTDSVSDGGVRSIDPPN